MNKAQELLESIEEVRKMDEGWVQDLIDYNKVEKVTVDDNKAAVKIPVKGAGSQDARRLMTHLGSLGYEAKMSTDNLAVIVKTDGVDKAKAKEEIGITI